MKMRQMMLLMVVGVGMMSTGCASVRGVHASLFPTPTPTPAWVGTPIGVVTKEGSTLTVHAVSGTQADDWSWQRNMCRMRATKAMGDYTCGVTVTVTKDKDGSTTKSFMSCNVSGVRMQAYWSEDDTDLSKGGVHCLVTMPVTKE